MTDKPHTGWAMTSRRFELHRDRDVSGVSGTGVVADGVRWPDGSVSIRWRGERPSVVFWHSLDDAEHVHAHGGATRFVWLDDEKPARLRWNGLNNEAAAEFCNEHGLGYRIIGPLLCITFAGSEMQALPGSVVACDGKSLTVDHRRADMRPEPPITVRHAAQQRVAHVPLLEPDELTRQTNDVLYRAHPEVSDGQ